MAKKLRAGIVVRTNAKYAKIIKNQTPHLGILIKQESWQAGLWRVDMRESSLTRHTRVHESMMEELVELETTAEAWSDLPKAKQKHLAWTSAGKDEWHAVVPDEKLPARIRELDKKTYSCFRNGKYLGSEPNLEDAKKRVIVNQTSQKNRVMRAWEMAHPDELPPGLQLTDSANACTASRCGDRQVASRCAEGNSRA